MRVVIFGAGKMFQIVKKNIKKEIEIVAFLEVCSTPPLRPIPGWNGPS